MSVCEDIKHECVCKLTLPLSFMQTSNIIEQPGQRKTVDSVCVCLPVSGVVDLCVCVSVCVYL